MKQIEKLELIIKNFTKRFLKKRRRKFMDFLNELAKNMSEENKNKIATELELGGWHLGDTFPNNKEVTTVLFFIENKIPILCRAIYDEEVSGWKDVRNDSIVSNVLAWK